MMDDRVVNLEAVFVSIYWQRFAWIELEREEVESEACLFRLTGSDTWTLREARNAAKRRLERIARDYGFCQARLTVWRNVDGLTKGAWIAGVYHISAFGAYQGRRKGSACGEYTLREAAGLPILRD